MCRIFLNQILRSKSQENRLVYSFIMIKTSKNGILKKYDKLQNW